MVTMIDMERRVVSHRNDTMRCDICGEYASEWLVSSDTAMGGSSGIHFTCLTCGESDLTDLDDYLDEVFADCFA